MNAGEEEHVKLKQEIPVHIVYFTAWADDAGGVRLVPDVYGYDATQSSH
jgi:murein L,D-transpeptidase YcbB/YkuD